MPQSADSVLAWCRQRRGPPWGYRGVPLYTPYLWVWGYLYIPTICTYGGTYIYMGRVGGVGRGTYIYLLYMCMCICLYTCYIYVCAYVYIHSIYVYVQRLIYTKVYVIPIARTYIKVWGYVYIGGSRVGQSARRQCTLFNFQRLPQYTNSRVVYKGLGLGVVRGQCQMHLDCNLDYYLDN